MAESTAFNERKKNRPKKYRAITDNCTRIDRVLSKKHNDLTDEDRVMLLSLIEVQHPESPRNAKRPLDREKIRGALLKPEAELTHAETALLAAFLGAVRIKRALLQKAEAASKPLALEAGGFR